MVKKFLAILVFLNISFFQAIGAIGNAGSWKFWSWNSKKQDVRIVSVINDLPQLIKDLSEETKELQEAIFSTIEVNGITVEPGREKMIPISSGKFTITVKSKRSLGDHVYPKSKIKKFLKKFSSIFSAYYGFVCSIPSDIDTISLAIPVLYGCEALQRNQSYELSYRWPRGVTIWPNEIIECD